MSDMQDHVRYCVHDSIHLPVLALQDTMCCFWYNQRTQSGSPGITCSTQQAPAARSPLYKCSIYAISTKHWLNYQGHLIAYRAPCPAAAHYRSGVRQGKLLVTVVEGKLHRNVLWSSPPQVRDCKPAHHIIWCLNDACISMFYFITHTEYSKVGAIN